MNWPMSIVDGDQHGSPRHGSTSVGYQTDRRSTQTGCRLEVVTALFPHFPRIPHSPCKASISLADQEAEKPLQANCGSGRHLAEASLLDAVDAPQRVGTIVSYKRSCACRSYTTEERKPTVRCFGRSDRRAQGHRLGCLETKDNGHPSTRHRHDGRCSRSPRL
jgi:hypothetical protein